MSINREDSHKINYKPDVDWHMERMYAIARGQEDLYDTYRPSEEEVSPDKLLGKFADLQKKARKLDDAIDSLSAAEVIPIDKLRQPRVSLAVKEIDPSSNGEHISYDLYKTLALQAEDGSKALTLDWGLENKTDDASANSELVRHRYGVGAKFTPKSSPDPEDQAGGLGEELKNEILDAISSWGNQEFHLKQILDFSNTFLANSRDAKYIPWNFKSDVRRKLVEYDNVTDFLSQYTDLANGLSESVELMPNTPLDLARDFYDALSGKADNDNNFFNKINDVLGFNYTADLVCCFSSWSSGLDVKTLKALKMVLSLVGNGMSFDYSKMLNALMDIINNLFKSMIGSALLGLVDKVFQLITNPIRNWLNTDDEKWQRIFLCTPIDELVNTYLLGGIAYLEKELIEKISEFLKTLEIDVHFEECKVTLMEKTKKLDAFIKIIDMMIDVAEKVAYCGLEDSPARDRISRALKNAEISPNWNYSYQKEDKPNKYNSFTRDVTVVEEIVNPNTGAVEVVERETVEFVPEIATERVTLSKGKIDECLKRISKDDVFSVQEWMEDLRAKAHGGS